MLGRLFFMNGAGNNIFSHRSKLFCNPGPNGDFPVIKGLVEMANYMGFDGY